MGSGFHGSDPKSLGAIGNIFFQGGLITFLLFPSTCRLRLSSDLMDLNPTDVRF